MLPSFALPRPRAPPAARLRVAPEGDKPVEHPAQPVQLLPTAAGSARARVAGDVRLAPRVRLGTGAYRARLRLHLATDPLARSAPRVEGVLPRGRGPRVRGGYPARHGVPVGPPVHPSGCAELGRRV
ncbi:hypothetical protein T492DRAFT_1097403 [Pavlovales sp. CCMP2436]|nr:hypothetical protein T492DRAFT_1097403 [Pavlovales sp. CCMP2436]